MAKLIALIIVVVSLSGCGTRGFLKALDEKAAQNFSPKDMILYKNADNEIDSALGPIAAADLIIAIDETALNLEDALRKFDTRCATPSFMPDCRLRRNAIQDRLIASSNAMCRDFKNSLKRTQAGANMGYGNAATLFGGIGAMVTSATPARILSGAAAIATGMRAEWNESMYSMLAVEIVTKAMDKTRSDALKEIDQKQLVDSASYSLQRSMADAEEYHSRCSLLAGLQEASSAVSQANNTGLKALNDSLSEFGQGLQVQVAKKSQRAAPGELVYLASLCKQLHERYETFISAHRVSESKADIAPLSNRWREVADKECGSSEKPNPTDVALEKTFLAIRTTADMPEQDKLRAQFTAKQGEVIAIGNYLESILSTVSLEMERRTKNHAAILQSQIVLGNELKNIQSEIKKSTDNEQFSTLASRLRVAAQRLNDMLARISTTSRSLQETTRAKGIAAQSLAIKISVDKNLNAETLEAATKALAEAFDDVRTWQPADAPAA